MGGQELQSNEANRKVKANNNLNLFCKNSVKCFYTNVDSLSNKKNELKILVKDFAPHVFGLTEIYPKRTRFPVTDAQFCIDGYSMITPDVRGRRGVALFIHQSMPAEVYHMMGTYPGIEHVWVVVTLGAEKLLLGSVYRSPSCSEGENDALNDLVEHASSLKFDKIIVMGDFNFPEIDWRNSSHPSNPNHRASKFYESCERSFLHQHVVDPTHRRGDQRPTLDDLVLTLCEDDIASLRHMPPIGKSHHDVIVFSVPAAIPPPSRRVTRPIYNLGDYETIRNELKKIEWDTLNTLSVEDAWNFLHHSVMSLCAKYIPSKTYDPSTPRKPPWMNDNIYTKIRHKRQLYRRKKRTRKRSDCHLYNRANRDLQKAIETATTEFEHKLAGNIKDNPKSFFAYANSQLKPKSAVPPLSKPDGGIASTDRDKAQTLNNFFVSVFTREDDPPQVSPDADHSTDDLWDVAFKPEEVEKKLRNLNPAKSPGPDMLHPRVLKELAEVIALPLSTIFKKSFSSGRLPRQWKDATVTPIYKKGSKSEPCNYRPVSLTSVVCKLMESFIRDSLIKHLTQTDQLSPHQHGFIPRRSCTTQLLETLELWTKCLDDDLSLDAVYLDFSKAFDSVPHGRLLQKLSQTGVKGPCLSWIKDFLHERRQEVSSNGEKSDWAPVSSGIPQGSVLGPVLFVAYINDLPEAVQNSQVKIFADDTKVFSRIKDEDDARRLQEDLDRLQEWSDHWLLRFNADKCKVLHVGPHNPMYDYHMSGAKLSSTDCEKDLGVYINSQLNAKDHIKAVIHKARQVLGMIRRSFTRLDKSVFVPLYKTLVRPHLEYGFSVWWPNTKADATALEKVQRDATRLVPGLRMMTYQERLKYLDLPSVTYRRHRGDILQAFKLLHGLYNISTSLLPLSNLSYNLSRHQYHLGKPRCNSNTRRLFFTQRVINYWNALPSRVVNAPSLNAMKANLDSHWGDYKFSVDPPPEKLAVKNYRY